MKSRKQIIRIASCLISCLTIIGFSLNGQVIKKTVEEMTHDAKTILHGKCTLVESSWDENQERIYTEIKVQAGEYLKGSQGSEITITVPGGHVGNYVYEVSDMPVFSEGEEFIAFLSEHSSGRNLVTGAIQGKLRVYLDPNTGLHTVNRPIDEPASLKKSAMIFDESTQKRETIPLDDFLMEIASYLEQ